MLDRATLLEAGRDAILDVPKDEQDTDLYLTGLLMTIAASFLIFADILVDECKAGGAIDQLRYTGPSPE